MTRTHLDVEQPPLLDAGPDLPGSASAVVLNGQDEPDGRLGLSTPRLGVFSDSRGKPIHRWYPFLEGYSPDLVARILATRGAGAHLIDPFGGCGTTALAASQLGLDSAFCEVNPYLSWVADVKVNVSHRASRDPALGELLSLAERLEHGFMPPESESSPLVVADARRGFFPPGVAANAAGLLEWIAENLQSPVRELAMLAVTTSLIPASNMVRRVDLRKRRGDDPPPAPLSPTVASQLRVIYADIQNSASQLDGRAKCVARDARRLGRLEQPVDTVITSPPYLNGTNYCRNTKLELLALGSIADEADLSGLRAASITAGINNVSRRRGEPDRIEAVEAIAAELDAVAYDRRIPALVRLYFSDMRAVFERVRANAVHGARWFLDIGDSRFAGVHVPTPHLLVEVAKGEGWSLVGIETLRSRRSYDGTTLTQVLLELVAV